MVSSFIQETNKTIRELGGYIAPLLLTLCLLGFLPDTSLNFRLGKQILAEWCLIALVSMYFFDNVWLKLFCLWSLIRMIMCNLGFDMPKNVINEYAKITYITFNTLFIYVVAMEVFKKYVKCSVDMLLNVICIISLIQVQMMVTQFFDTWTLFVPKNVVPSGAVTLIDCDRSCTGFFSNINMSASFLALALPAFFRKKWNLLIPFMVIGVMISDSLGGQLPFFIALLVYLLILFKNVYVRTVIIFSTAIFLTVAFVSGLGSIKHDLFGGGRIQALEVAFKNILSKEWLYGIGLGQFKMVPFYINKTRWLQLHNEYIQLWIELGIFGLIFALGYIQNIIKKSIKYKLWIPLAGILIGLFNCGVNFLFHTTACIVMLIYCAVIDREVEK